jgi:chemotaxis signal transduction protein
MSPDPAPASAVAAKLRLDFDRGFAAPAQSVQSASVDLIALRVAGEGYALRLAAIAGLYVGRSIVPLPGAAPVLLGIAGLRGSLVAVYDLGALLGHARSAAPRWVALLRDETAVGLAFEKFEGLLRVAPHEVAPAAGAAPGRRVGEVVRAGGAPRPVVDVAAVLQRLAGLARAGGRPEEG